jgi:protein-S-isoprenylcysteine O-methyltransferase Ste14
VTYNPAQDLAKYGGKDMDKNEKQYIVGYLAGGLLVLVLVPLGLYGLGRALDPLIPTPLIASTGLRVALTIILAVIGMLFGFWSIIVQRTIGEGGPVQVGNVDISPRTRKLVVSGPYKYTRNPMLFGAFGMYAAFAVGINSIFALAGVLVFIIGMLIFVKRSEEPRLQRDFGEQYLKYRRQVSMFIPWFQRRIR